MRELYIIQTWIGWVPMVTVVSIVGESWIARFMVLREYCLVCALWSHRGVVLRCSLSCLLPWLPRR